ncbi:hypothetical protein VNI00_006436 [Paramarasmius palmivorus]|uniref:Uncharacterized protein n=1 Tax=Paramarasmius palmivorus TaxID=297713 RepID=A0AAW0D5E7_9AGAR
MVSGLEDLSLWGVPLFFTLLLFIPRLFPTDFFDTLMVGFDSEPSTSKATMDRGPKSAATTPTMTSKSKSPSKPQLTAADEDDEYDKYNLSAEITQAMIDACVQVEKDYEAYQAAKRQVPVSRAKLDQVIDAFDRLWDKESQRPSTSGTTAPLPPHSAAPPAPRTPVSSPPSSQARTVPPLTPTKTTLPPHSAAPESPRKPLSSPPNSQTRTVLPSTPTKTPLRGSQPPPVTPLKEYLLEF